MITTGAKFFLAITGLAVVAAVVYGWGSHGGLLGVVSLGLRGGVGEHAGFVILMFVAMASFALGVALVACRDADPEALAAVARSETVPAATPPADVSYWPVVGAFAVAVVVLGLVISSVLFVVGLVIAGIVVIEWMVQAWSERATGDPEVNRQIRNRLMYPFEIPLVGAIGIAVVVLAVSRVLLALPANGSSAIAIVVAALVLGTSALIAARPTLSRNMVTAVLVLGALAVIVGGIVAAATGEREFEEHEEEHGSVQVVPDSPAGVVS